MNRCFNSGISNQIIFLLTLTLVLLACGKQDLSNPAFKRKLETRLNIKVPDNVKWLGLTYDSRHDDFIAVGFQIQRDEIGSLFNSLGPTKWSTEKRSINDGNFQSGWFKPDSISKFKSTEVQSSDRKMRIRVLYDDSLSSGSSPTTVYLIWLKMP